MRKLSGSVLQRFVLGAAMGAIVCLCLGGAARASELKDQSNLFELGVFAGVLIPSSNHEWHNPTIPQHPLKDVALDVGARLAYLPLPYLGAEFEFALMPTKTDTDLTATLWGVRGHLIAQYPARVAPFLVLGAGGIAVSSDDNALGKDMDAIMHGGLGLKWYATDWMNLRVDGRLNLGPKNGEGGMKVLHFEALAGLSFVLNWKKDEPKDTDGDGLTDDKDKCPNEAAKTEDGCPLKDTDGDGLTDDVDKCPTEAAKTEDGCPIRDTDGDGLTDDKDKCPNEAATTPDGCPIKDTDGDGFLDDVDKCPNEEETRNGYEDQDGCPDEVPQAIQKFTGTIQGITFDLGKATIRKGSYRVLDAAARLLAEYPNLKLIIRGHTDNTGSRERNMTLSKDRADAVRDYLTGKGVDGARLRTEGLGPEEPIEDNTIPAGRAKNRRIEFKIDVQ